MVSVGWLDFVKTIDGKEIDGKKYGYNFNINFYVVYPEGKSCDFKKLARTYEELQIIWKQ
jgi:hypothetical protein